MAGLALLGVRTTPGVVNVTIDTKNADGTPGGMLQTIIATPEWNFQTIWPTSPESIRMTSEPAKPAGDQSRRR